LKTFTRFITGIQTTNNTFIFILRTTKYITCTYNDKITENINIKKLLYLAGLDARNQALELKPEKVVLLQQKKGSSSCYHASQKQSSHD